MMVTPNYKPRDPVAEFRRVLEADPTLLAKAASRCSSESASEEDGAVIVRDLEAFFTRYVVLPERTALPLALWVLLTYTFKSFDAVPYLIINSPAPRCGKTRLLECLELVVSSSRRASNISEAALFRIIEKIAPTLLLDEAETLSGKSERAEYLRQILNAGNRRGALVTRCLRQGENDAVDFSVFCPKVLAGIGHFPATITDRAIIIPMQRRKDSEEVARFLYKTANPEGAALRDRACQFIGQRKDEVEAAYGKADLDFISDRDAEAWSPLFAILAIADVSRLKELRDSAVRLTQTKISNAEDDNLSLRLLADVRSVWPVSEPKIFTGELIQRLKGIEDGHWVSDEKFDGRKLGRFLKPFGVTPATVQIGKDNRKGYYREAVEAAFTRYLWSEPSGASEPA
jgi:Protein of unknown function (DUF3631)